jgi:hypothetical protein
MLETASQGTSLRKKTKTAVLADPFARKRKKHSDESDVDNKDFGVHGVNTDGKVGSRVDCPDNCNFRGFCDEGVCFCQPGFEGKKCQTATMKTKGTLNLTTTSTLAVVGISAAFLITYIALNIRRDSKKIVRV